jgi:hypothetical protein
MASTTRGNKKKRRGIAPPTFFCQNRIGYERTRFIAVRLNLLPLRASYPQEDGFMGRAMADRAGLGFLGFILGGVTVAVMLVAATMVIGHIDGRFIIDTAPTQIAANE